MIEKLSTELIRKVFYALTNGNEDIAFYTNCMRNRNREKAANSPAKFGLKLLGYNIFYRIPFVKKMKIHRKVGRDYLSNSFYRLPVVDLFSEIYSCDEIVCDVFDSVCVPEYPKEMLFKMIGERLGDKRFYKLRMKYDCSQLTLEEIYMKINHRLYTAFTYDEEIELVSKNLMWNEYAVRLLDIAVYNNIRVTLIAPSCYDQKLIKKLLKQGGVSYDRLYITSIEKADKADIAKKNCGKNTGVFSADFKGFIKPLKNFCTRKVFYPSPSELVEKTTLPTLSEEFKNEFERVCGLGLFSGIRHSSYRYELGYMCLGAMAYILREKLREYEGNTICFAHEFSVLTEICGENMLFSDFEGLRVDGRNYNVVNVGNRNIDFEKFFSGLKKTNPDTIFVKKELGGFISHSSDAAQCLFTNKHDELSKGAVDFVSDYDERSFSKSLTESDADSLYSCGYSTIFHLYNSSRSVASGAISVSI